MRHFGSWVREKRESLGMTETECALRASMKLQQWNRMEKRVNKPQVQTIEAVARGLKVSVGEVFTAVSNPGQPPIEADKEITEIVESLPPEKRPAFLRAVRSMADAMMAA